MVFDHIIRMEYIGSNLTAPFDLLQITIYCCQLFRIFLVRRSPSTSHKTKKISGNKQLRDLKVIVTVTEQIRQEAHECLFSRIFYVLCGVFGLLRTRKMRESWWNRLKHLERLKTSLFIIWSRAFSRRDPWQVDHPVKSGIWISTCILLFTEFFFECMFFSHRICNQDAKLTKIKMF